MRIAFILIFVQISILFSYRQESHLDFKNNKDTLTLLTFGHPSPDLYQYIKTAPKYNFKLHWIGGCTVDQQLIDSIYKHNQIVDSLLDKMNDAGWRDKYEEEVKETFSRDSSLIAALKKTKLVRSQLDLQQKHGNGLQFLVDSSIDNNTFRIQVIGYLNDKYGSRGSYYRVIMRHSDFKILSVDDSLIVLSKFPTKTCSIPILGKDTSYWYKRTQFIIQKTKDVDLQKTRQYFHVRIWTEKQYIEVSYNFQGYEFGTVTNYTTSKKTGKFYSSSDIINEDDILILMDSFNLTEIPSENEIHCWGRLKGDTIMRNCNDGITYSIEFSTDTTYSFKTYSCPDSWDCEEARRIQNFYKQLDKILGLETMFDKFIQTLPNDCYDNGMTYLRCTDKKSTRKKNRS